ncbi:MAG: hypothetical protein JNM13_14140 [Hyphomicrobiaceae bacterium]|nr:hypothetical protein [Hyphomicrobiaceae bacterium]
MNRLLVLSLAAVVVALPAAGHAAKNRPSYKPVSFGYREIVPEPGLTAAVERVRVTLRAKDAAALEALLGDGFVYLTGSIDPGVSYRKYKPAKGQVLIHIGDSVPVPMEPEKTPPRPAAEIAAGKAREGLAEVATGLDGPARFGADPALPGLVCWKGGFSLDRKAFNATAKSVGAAQGASARVVLSPVEVRAKGEATAAVIGRLEPLKSYFEFYEYELGDYKGWETVLLPDGKVGFVPSDTLIAPLNHGLCFGKTAKGDWEARALISLSY